VNPGAILAALQNLVTLMEITEATFDSEVFKALAAPALSFEYDYNTPQSQESNSVFKLIGSMGFFAPKKTSAADPQKTVSAGAPRLTGTLNVGAQIYNATPPSSVPGSVFSAPSRPERSSIIPFPPRRSRGSSAKRSAIAQRLSHFTIRIKSARPS
jgi:hypothetical protein